jgi:hypothetical protein
MLFVLEFPRRYVVDDEHASSPVLQGADRTKVQRFIVGETHAQLATGSIELQVVHREPPVMDRVINEPELWLRPSYDHLCCLA